MEFKAPPKADLDEMLDMHASGVYGTLKDGIKDFRPMLLVEYYDPIKGGESAYDVVVIATDFNTWAEKSTLMRRIGKEYYDKRVLPIAVALASEAWVSADAANGKSPSECDDRKEIILLAAQSLEKVCKLRQMLIARDRNGKIIQAPFVEWDNSQPQFPLIDQFFFGFAAPVFEKVDDPFKRY